MVSVCMLFFQRSQPPSPSALPCRICHHKKKKEKEKMHTPGRPKQAVAQTVHCYFHGSSSFLLRSATTSNNSRLCCLLCRCVYSTLSKWKVTPFLFCLFLPSWFDFTIVSLLMRCHWKFPPLGTLAQRWLMGGVHPSIMMKASLARFITSSKACYSSPSYHWFLLIKQFHLQLNLVVYV